MNQPRTYQRASLALSSLAPDLIPQDAPAEVWNTGNNVFFRNGETLRATGDSPTLPGAAVDARTLVFVRSASIGYWVYATETGIFAHDGSVEFDLTPPGWLADAGATFTSCVLNGIAFINASNTQPVFWDGNVLNPCQPLPDWPNQGRCLALRAHKNFLFAIGMLSEGGSGGQRVRWSDAASAGEVPQFWTAAPDNLAGDIDLAPLSSAAVDGASLRNSFLIYKQESVWSFDFVGGNAVFQVRKLFAEHGLANTNALTLGIDDVHLFVGNEGDVFITDGVRVNSVLDGRAQRAFFADFTSNTDALFASATLAREKLGILAYPMAGSFVCDRALLYDFVSGDIGFRDMPDVLCIGEGQALKNVGQANAWDGDPQPWDNDNTAWPQDIVGATLDDVVAGGSFGFVLVSDAGAEDFITGPVTAQIEKGGLSFGDPSQRKMVSRIWPKIIGRLNDTLEIRLGGQEITGGPISLTPPITFVIGQSTSIDTFVQGRFLFMEITSTGGAPWRMGSLDIEFRGLGNF